VRPLLSDSRSALKELDPHAHRHEDDNPSGVVPAGPGPTGTDLYSLRGATSGGTTEAFWFVGLFQPHRYIRGLSDSGATLPFLAVFGRDRAFQAFTVGLLVRSACFQNQRLLTIAFGDSP
jgi:hypothetical protein